MVHANSIQKPVGLRTLLRGEGIFEGPAWREDGLVFTNVTKGGAYLLDISTGEATCVVPHRKGMGGLALANGGFIVSGRNISFKPFEGETVVLSPGADTNPMLRGYNDLTVDPHGAVIAGALGLTSLNPSSMTGHETAPEEGAGTGGIWRISRASRIKVASDIAHPNGIAISSNGRLAYVSDTLRHLVYRFRINGDVWSNREVFAVFEHGHTDGMALAADGSLWVALASKGQIAVIEPSGELRSLYSIETPLLTNLCFGGADLRTVFVTTGSLDGRDPALVLSFRSDVPGMLIPTADFGQPN